MKSRLSVPVALAVLGCGASSPSQPDADTGRDAAPDAFDARVHVRLIDAANNVMVQTSVEFLNPDGAIVAGTVDAVGTDWLAAAPVLAGGRVKRSDSITSSPTSHSSGSSTVVGVMPGDHLTFGGSFVPLPSDCRPLGITSPAWTGSGVSWSQTEAGTVNLRYVAVSTQSISPPVNNQAYRVLDGETAAGVSLPEVTFTPTEVKVVVLTCASHIYDDLRSDAARYAMP